MKQFFPVLLLLLAACTTQPKREEVEQSETAAARKIDYWGLQRHLGLVRADADLGYREKSYNTCEVGFGYSSSHDCTVKRFVTVNIRLQCRDSEGTISTGLTAADLQPIAGRQVRWALSGDNGTVATDGEGYAQIGAIFSNSPRADRLRIAVGDQFLYMRAGEITRVVVPRPWCNQ